MLTGKNRWHQVDKKIDGIQFKLTEKNKWHGTRLTEKNMLVAPG
jgi:hypothetical protein